MPLVPDQLPDPVLVLRLKVRLRSQVLAVAHDLGIAADSSLPSVGIASELAQDARLWVTCTRTRTRGGPAHERREGGALQMSGARAGAGAPTSAWYSS